ncbi:MAG TPA: DUF1565 domain-containing protein [Rhizomicrobium sp.]|nr:DUF1565 domain-containing protein [Rhizomicrobium sp.]
MGFAFLAVGGAAGICAAQAGVKVAISPTYAQLVAGQTIRFSATVSGSTDTRVVWQVNNADGGAAESGTISKSGVYAPPQSLPNPALVTITAEARADRAVSATASLTLLNQAPSGATYYVATNGSDTNDGSKGSPWATVQHAAEVVAAGDTVLVRGGVYNEYVGFTKSGDARNGYITFANYPGETATIDGTGLGIPGRQFGLFTLKDVSYVIVEGFELRNYTTAKLKDVPLGIYVLGAGRALQIVNNRIHHIWTTAKTTPRQCGSDAFGLTVYGTKAPQAIDGIAISGNELYRLKTGCSETLSLDGNVKNFAIVSNIVHDDDNIGIGAIGFEHVSPNPAYDQARDGEIRGNVVYNITSYGNPDYGRQYASDGIYVDGGRDIVIEQNLMHNDDLGIELASEHKDHVTSEVIARNNVVYAGNSAGISIGGYGAKRGGTDRCIVVNNTLFDNDTKMTGSGEFQIQFHAMHNRFFNNVAYAGAQALLINDFTTSTPDPAEIDYNLYFAKVGAKKATFVWQHQRYRGYETYRAATGLDRHSPPFSNPRFENTATPPDLDIARTSPAIGAGKVLDPSIVGTHDFLGRNRVKEGAIDLGAYER